MGGMGWVDIFFFQAEDGIRDVAVTGVQTCALPISPEPISAPRDVTFVSKGISDAFEPGCGRRDGEERAAGASRRRDASAAWEAWRARTPRTPPNLEGTAHAAVAGPGRGARRLGLLRGHRRGVRRRPPRAPADRRAGR